MRKKANEKHQTGLALTKEQFPPRGGLSKATIFIQKSQLRGREINRESQIGKKNYRAISNGGMKRRGGGGGHDKPEATNTINETKRKKKKKKKELKIIESKKPRGINSPE